MALLPGLDDRLVIRVGALLLLWRYGAAALHAAAVTSTALLLTAWASARRCKRALLLAIGAESSPERQRLAHAHSRPALLRKR